MARRVKPVFTASFLLFTLAGCAVVERAERPAWRAQAENACLSQNLVQVSNYIQPAKEISGPGICGMTHPFKISALADGSVALNSDATLACPMLPALDQWIAETVQPAAQARFGQAVVMVKSMGSYGCRPVNNQRGASLSEHGFGNAIDVGGFRLADGREINVKTGWKGEEQEAAFLHEVHAGACNQFTTVLGPGSDAFHYDHIHVDLAMHGNTSQGRRRICKPVPQPQFAPAPGPRLDTLPDPPMIEEEQEIALGPRPDQAPAPGGLLPPAGVYAARPLQAAPRTAYAPQRPAPAAAMRADGVIEVPEGTPDDWDITSSVPKKR